MAKILKPMRLSEDIVSSLNAYARRRGITFTAAAERMLLKAIELEDSVVTKENTIVIKPVEEEIEIKALNEDDGAMLDIFADIPD
jgi:hypothetical protein